MNSECTTQKITDQSELEFAVVSTKCTLDLVWQLFLYNKKREIFSEKKNGPINRKTLVSCEFFFSQKTSAKTESANKLSELNNARNKLKSYVYCLKHTR